MSGYGIWFVKARRLIGSVTTGKHDRLIEFDHLVMHQRNDLINACAIELAILCLCPYNEYIA